MSEVHQMVMNIISRVAPEKGKIIKPEMYGEELMGKSIDLDPIQMVYIAIEIKKAINKNITSEEYINYFHSVDTISNLVAIKIL